MTGEEQGSDFVTLPPDIGTRARRAGLLQRPPEQLYGWAGTTESNQEGEAAGTPYNGNQSAPGGTLVTATEFAQEEEDMGEPLLGTTGDMLLAGGGTLFMYGKGGAGKTTLTLDGIAHLASGTEWLGQPVPAPVKIILIENEGPRALLRRRVRDKLDTWEGTPWGEQVLVWTDPWMGFTFRNEAYREQVAHWVTEHEAELVVVGPLAAIGAIGGGTPDEVSTFGALLEDVRRRTPLELAFWIVHHENKAGDVSGAWDRLPDTLAHVTAIGNGHTRLHLQKARWSTLHDTVLNLSWNGTRSFTVDEPKPDADEMVTRVRELYEEEDRWRSTEEVRIAVEGKKPTVTAALEHLAATGWLTEQKGVEGYQWNARCWCHQPSETTEHGRTLLDQPLDQELDPSVNKPGSSGSSNATAGPRVVAGPRNPPPRKGWVAGPANEPATDTTTSNDPDHDIPF